jgi:uncharacterized phiE125 gp8 family phage protein
MLKVIVAPDELISVADAAAFMRAEFADNEEALIESLITAARQWCEDYLRRAIGVQTLELRVQGFPANNNPILLRSPIVGVTSVKYLDQNRVEQTLSPSEYEVSDSEPATITPVSAWPVSYGSADSARVVYEAGYYLGGSPKVSEELPKTIRTAMLMLVADMYANREAQVERALVANPTVERLLSMYRLEMAI